MGASCCRGIGPGPGRRVSRLPWRRGVFPFAFFHGLWVQDWKDGGEGGGGPVEGGWPVRLWRRRLPVIDWTFRPRGGQRVAGEEKGHLKFNEGGQSRLSVG